MNREDNFKRIKNAKNCLSHLACTTCTRKKPQTFKSKHLLNGFLRDETKILQSRAFRRLPRKAQIVTQPRNINVRNRLTHTMEVTSLAISIAEYLGLNVNLTRAIALGHDLGHVPFGHQGEHYLAHKSGENFNHRIMALIVLQDIERDSEGLNLSKETLDGIYYHSGPEIENSMTQEAKVVHYADRIANAFADINDFPRLGFSINKNLKQQLEKFGEKQRDRVDTAISYLCEESQKEGCVSFKNSKFAKNFYELETSIYEIYPQISPQDVSHLFDPVYDFFKTKTNINPIIGISLMTDDDVLHFNQTIDDTSLKEISHVLENIKINFDDPNLSW